MEKIHIMPTEKTPEILLDPDGLISIRGRGLTSHRAEYYQQIGDWVESYIKNPADETNVTIALDYMNMNCVRIVISTLRALSVLVPKSKRLFIYWYYESDDDDMLERGEQIVSIINTPINFIVTDNINKS